jgi:hypothetical protein
MYVALEARFEANFVLRLSIIRALFYYYFFLFSV